MQVPVQTKDMKLLVIFIFVAAALRDFDDGRDYIWRLFPDGKIQIISHFAPLQFAQEQKTNSYTLVGVISLPYAEALNGGFLRHTHIGITDVHRQHIPERCHHVVTEMAFTSRDKSVAFWMFRIYN